MKIDSVHNCILIAEDDRMSRMILQKGLKDLPFEFHFAEDGDEAWEMITQNSYDLMLLDVEMPGMTSFELITKFNKAYPDFNIPILFMTGNSDRESINQGFCLGGVDYITKP
jgi:CheY-like chemotaxis protein